MNFLREKTHKGTTFIVILASLGIVALIGLAILVTVLFSSEQKAGTLVAVQTEATPKDINPASTHTDTPLGEDGYHEAAHDYIFVGDSRTVAMKKAVTETYPEDTCTYIAKEGEGYEWLYHHAIVELEELLRERPDATVIFNLGINDLDKLNSYISFYKEVFAAHPNTNFYFMSVNPIEPEKFNNRITTEDVITFNQRFIDEFPEQYLDCYNHLLSEDFSTIDGLHYHDSTSLKIHHYAIMILVK